MKILLTADPELPVPPTLYGGIERIIDSIVRGLQSRGHRVGLVAREGSNCPADDFYPWPGKASQSRRSTFSNCIALEQAIRRFKPDLLHSFSRLAYMLPLLPGTLPKIMSYQRQPSIRTTKWARRLSFRSLTFTGCSDHICNSGRLGGGTWDAIPNFIELDTYDFNPTVPDDAPLVFLSRIERIKGTHTAIEIARKSGRRLLIAGNRIDSGEAAEYWKTEIEPQLDDQIEYVGPVNDVQKNHLLGSAAAMIVPIEWEEPFGIVFAEALACGTPVISCPRGALAEILTPGLHGFLVTNVQNGVDAVNQLSTIDRQACRSHAETRFSCAAVITQYEALYQRRLGRQ